MRQFPKITESLVNGGVGLYCEKLFLRSNFFRSFTVSTFIHLSLGKAGPFTLENHIHVKALKMQDFPIIRCLITVNPYLKTAPTQFFKGVPRE